MAASGHLRKWPRQIGFAKIGTGKGVANGLAMWRPIAKTIAATTIGVMLLAAVAVAAVPTVRHFASGWWSNREGLAALPENLQVHYESGASQQAGILAALLPTAIAQVEAVHGRRFASVA
jgi:hypothetical protein